jgi:hypothetical protein
LVSNQSPSADENCAGEASIETFTRRDGGNCEQKLFEGHPELAKNHADKKVSRSKGAIGMPTTTLGS